MRSQAWFCISAGGGERNNTSLSPEEGLWGIVEQRKEMNCVKVSGLVGVGHIIEDGWRV